MPKFHGVTRDKAQRLLLEKTVRSGTASAHTVTRARIRLQADTGPHADMPTRSRASTQAAWKQL